MELVRWNPVRDIFGFRNRFNRLFDDTFFPTTETDDTWPMWNWKPVVDIVDNEENFVIKAEIPGVDKKDIVVDVNDRVLTLKGERSSEKEVKEDSYCRKERTYGKFERSFILPSAVDPDSIKAEYKDGVLVIDIPKPEEKKPKKIAVH